MITSEESSASTQLPSVSVRFCGDSGDGMQLTGSHFTDIVALAGKDFATAPDFQPKLEPQEAHFLVSRDIKFSFQAKKFTRPVMQSMRWLR